MPEVGSPSAAIDAATGPGPNEPAAGETPDAGAAAIDAFAAALKPRRGLRRRS
jgi:hypothetical protein